MNNEKIAATPLTLKYLRQTVQQHENNIELLKKRLAGALVGQIIVSYVDTLTESIEREQGQRDDMLAAIQILENHAEDVAAREHDPDSCKLLYECRLCWPDGRPS